MVPGGVICFFPSYDYEAFVYSHFEKQGFIEKLEARKKVFREPKKTGQMDQVFKVPYIWFLIFRRGSKILIVTFTTILFRFVSSIKYLYICIRFQ